MMKHSRTGKATKPESRPQSRSQRCKTKKRITDLPVTVEWSDTASKPHIIRIGKHTLRLSRTEDEIKSDEGFYDGIRELPVKAQAFRILERRRNDASYGLQQQRQKMDALKRQLREACLEVYRHERTQDMVKDCLAVLSEDHATDFRQMDYSKLKATRKPDEKYYATSHCWMCACLMGLEDFKPHRMFCGNSCAQDAVRRRTKMRRLTTTKGPETPPDKWPCPYCARPLTSQELAKVSRPHYLDPTERKRFQREQQVIADVYRLT
jgi:hypothetical protein